MIIISPAELYKEQDKYLDLAEKEKVVVKNRGKLIHLVVKEIVLTDDDLEVTLTKED